MDAIPLEAFGEGRFSVVEPSAMPPTPAASAFALAPFVVTAGIAAGLVEGEDWTTYRDGSRAWTGDGLAKLRAAGWSGELREEPDIEAVLAGRPAATATTSTTAFQAALSPTRAAPAAARPTPPIAAAPPAPRPAMPTIDYATVMRRSQIGDAAYVAEQAAAAQHPTRPKPRNFHELAAQVYGRLAAEREHRQAAARSRGAGPGRIDHDAIYARLAKAENRAPSLPDPAEIFERRRSATGARR